MGRNRRLNELLMLTSITASKADLLAGFLATIQRPTAIHALQPLGRPQAPGYRRRPACAKRAAVPVARYLREMVDQLAA